MKFSRGDPCRPEDAARLSVLKPSCLPDLRSLARSSVFSRSKPACEDPGSTARRKHEKKTSGILKLRGRFFQQVVHFITGRSKKGIAPDHRKGQPADSFSVKSAGASGSLRIRQDLFLRPDEQVQHITARRAQIAVSQLALQD